MPEDFQLKDSGKRKEFQSGMVRDTEEGKLQWHRLFQGPMAERYVQHLTKGAEKYPDVAPMLSNWMLANGAEERARAIKSTVRHFAQWLYAKMTNTPMDEDHGAAVFFGINQTEYIENRPDFRMGEDDA